jgi:2-amino-4-hydroxy-6-hydroxymethyldihydropteridine diphosphokinase
VLELPTWARVTERRRQHIERVTELLRRWAEAMELDAETADEWRDAGRWHDALRDAPESELRDLAPELAEWAPDLLHGPAAAARLERGGEGRPGLLAAIRWHTLGHPDWSRTGRALFMADFLEPGRRFSRADRAFLAGQVPADFEGVFRQVVRMRLEWTLREGHELHRETVALWNAVR